MRSHPIVRSSALAACALLVVACSEQGGGSEGAPSKGAPTGAASAPAGSPAGEANEAPEAASAAANEADAGPGEPQGEAETEAEKKRREALEKRAKGGVVEKEDVPADDPRRIAQAMLMYQFFADVEAGRLDEAEKRFLSEAECAQIWTDTSMCGEMVKGTQEGLDTLRTDPVPPGSFVRELYLGERQTMGEDRGVQAPVGIWVGHIIVGETPSGHQFALKSLGVLEAPTGLRLLWGKRRTGGDTPRTPPPSEGVAGKSDPSPADAPAADGQPAEGQ